MRKVVLNDEYGLSGSSTRYFLKDTRVQINTIKTSGRLEFNSCPREGIITFSYILTGQSFFVGADNQLIQFKANRSSVFTPTSAVKKSILEGQRDFLEVRIEVEEQFLKNHGIDSTNFVDDLGTKKAELPKMHDICPSEKEILKSILEIHLNTELLAISLKNKVLALIIAKMKKGGVSEIFSCPKNKALANTLKRIMENGVNQFFSSKTLAREVGVSESKIKKVFKEVFHKTLNEYMVDLKMEAAKKLLQSSDLPIYEISDRVGYKNATHFTAAFKRTYQHTPKFCRKSTSAV